MTTSPDATTAPESFVLENASIVLPDAVLRGWLAVARGRIVEIGEGAAPERGIDCGGDTLIPGLVELHTDHLESHYAPRPKVRWHPLGAVLAYDAQIAASGITTVFDSLRAGTEPDGSELARELLTLAEALDEARRHRLLRAEHHIHLRCEVAAQDVVEMVENFAAIYPVRLLSLMDHTPGQRQFRDLTQYLVYFGARLGRTDAEVRGRIAEKQRRGGALAEQNRPALVTIAQARGITLASHDDATREEVREAARQGVRIAEFPTTIEAAQASREHGIIVMMGAPNLVRGGSHSGNVAAHTLAEHGLLDVLSSDYVPASLMMAAFALPERVSSITLPEAIRTVTLEPARATGLNDRGAIVEGLRADLVRVRLCGGMPVVRQVWRAGERVA